MKKEEAAVRILFEDRLNNIQQDLTGQYAFLSLKTEDGGLSTLLAGGPLDAREVLAAIAMGTATAIKNVANDKKEAETMGVGFVRAFGRAMTKEGPEPEISIWRDEDE